MQPPRSNRFRLAPRIIAAFAFAYAYVWITRYPRYYDDNELSEDSRRPFSQLPYHVHHDQIVINIRTSATEAFVKVPMLLLLMDPAHYDQTNIMSDLQRNIGPFQVHDVLDRYESDFVASTPDMEHYRQLQQFVRDGQDISLLRDADPRKERETYRILDKYRYPRIIERAWELKPDRKWYVFIDTETYLVHPNLIGWLGMFNPDDNQFFANPPSHTSDTVGAEVFVLSVGLIKRLTLRNERMTFGRDELLSQYASAYEALTKPLMEDLHVSHNHSWPSISNFQPNTVPFGPDVWCQPVVAIHDISTVLASKLWQMQQDREEYSVESLTFADLYRAMVRPADLDQSRDDWDNLSAAQDNAPWNILFEGLDDAPHTQHHTTEHEFTREREKKDIVRASQGEESFEACETSCTAKPDCMQFSYSSIPMANHNENGETRCHLSQSFRLGSAVNETKWEVRHETDGVHWKSGWKKERFEAWVKEQRCT